MIVGEELRDILHQRNRKQSDLARYLGVSDSTVSRWISRNRISKKWQIGVSEFLETSDKCFYDEKRSIYEIILPMTKDQKINVIQFILGTL